MNPVLWPRLGPVSQTDLLRRLRTSTAEELRGNSALEHYDTTWYPTGNRVGEPAVQAVQDTIREAAETSGWPDPAVGDNAKRRFDQTLSERLAPAMSMIPADAAHPAVWAFVTLVVAPDAARWRYPDNRDERYVGRTDRNTFGRLWWRHHRLGPLGAALLEDQAVAIIERPSIGGRHRLATSLARAIATHPSSSQDLMREAAKNIRRVLPVIEVGALGDDELDELVNEAIRAASRSLDGPARRGTPDLGRAGQQS